MIALSSCMRWNKILMALQFNSLQYLWCTSFWFDNQLLLLGWDRWCRDWEVALLAAANLLPPWRAYFRYVSCVTADQTIIRLYNVARLVSSWLSRCRPVTLTWWSSCGDKCRVETEVPPSHLLKEATLLSKSLCYHNLLVTQTDPSTTSVMSLESSPSLSFGKFCQAWKVLLRCHCFWCSNKYFMKSATGLQKQRWKLFNHFKSLLLGRLTLEPSFYETKNFLLINFASWMVVFL